MTSRQREWQPIPVPEKISNIRIVVHFKSITDRIDSSQIPAIKSSSALPILVRSLFLQPLVNSPVSAINGTSCCIGYFQFPIVAWNLCAVGCYLFARRQNGLVLGRDAGCVMKHQFCEFQNLTPTIHESATTISLIHMKQMVEIIFSTCLRQNIISNLNVLIDCHLEDENNNTGSWSFNRIKKFPHIRWDSHDRVTVYAYLFSMPSGGVHGTQISLLLLVSQPSPLECTRWHHYSTTHFKSSKKG